MRNLINSPKRSENSNNLNATDRITTNNNTNPA